MTPDHISSRHNPDRGEHVPLTGLRCSERPAGKVLEPGTMFREDGSVAKASESKAGEKFAKLKFEKKNQSMAKLPPNLIVERRPLIHAPIASPSAGAGVQKVVYVSRNTPIMAAVKRVKKLLLHVEKRAMQGVDPTKDRNGMRKLAEANERLGKNGEAVLVKASGRAMEQALRVGEWFKNREDELACNVDVRTGSVQAVDDVMEKEADETAAGSQPENTDDTSAVETLDTSLLSASERLASSTQPPIQTSDLDDSAGPVSTNGKEGIIQDSTSNVAKAAETLKKRKRRGKRKKSMLDEDTSARIRWVNTVEVAISLKC